MTENTTRSPWQDVQEALEPGTLYVIATPIGNLADITLRALYFLAHVDLIAAEDTRHTRLLLERHGIHTPMRAYHEHNAQQVLPSLLDHLANGSTLGLVSDAGTPGVSDPGYRLIHAAIEQGYPVIPLPGASAALAALVPSGLPMDRFTFEGFLPKKKGRKTRLDELADETRTMIFYESPQRVGKTLQELAQVFGGERIAVMARELTKSYEEFVRGTLGELSEKYRDTTVKGEIALVVEGRGKRIKRLEKGVGEEDNSDVRDPMKKYHFPEMPTDWKKRG